MYINKCIIAKYRAFFFNNPYPFFFNTRDDSILNIISEVASTEYFLIIENEYALMLAYN